MSAEDIQNGISAFLQFGALLGILSTAIYLFIALKNYFKQTKIDKVNMEKTHQENIERIKKAMSDDIMNDLGPRIDKNISEMKRMNDYIQEKEVSVIDNKKRLDEMDKWRVNIEKKFIVYDMRLPELENIRKNLDIIKNLLLRNK